VGYTNGLILYIRTISCCTCPCLRDYTKSSYLLNLFFKKLETGKI